MGCTGSIGRSTLRILEAWKDRFSVTALACGRNINLLAQQAGIWRPPYLAVLEKDGENGAAALRRLLPAGYRPRILAGPEGYREAASLEDADVVVSAQMGAAGLRATLAAAASGRTICLANKESLVLAGDFIRSLCSRTGANLLPVDSEHWAIFQCLAAHSGDVSGILLTASGGPFRTLPADKLPDVRPADALAHPNWSMGSKITIDSATLMNKGLEMIEACHLYQIPLEKIRPVIHPQSVVHSMVEFSDGSILGQLAVPDMRIPIAGCLAWPSLLDAGQSGTARLDLAALGTLTFDEPRRKDFPCLDLACSAFRQGLTVAMNAANEVAVERFLRGEIRFTGIPALVEDVLSHSVPPKAFPVSENVPQCVQNTIEAIEYSDTEARAAARSWRP